MIDRQELCSFTVGDLYLGVCANSVQEVIQYQAMTRMPQAPEAVRGLINLRGQIITAIDMRICLGYEPFTDDDRPMNIIIRDGVHLVSLLVDTINDVCEMDPSTFEETPGTVKSEYREIIRGAYKLEKKILIEIEPSKLLSRQSVTDSDGNLEPVEVANA